MLKLSAEEVIREIKRIAIAMVDAVPEDARTEIECVGAALLSAVVLADAQGLPRDQLRDMFERLIAGTKYNQGLPS